MKNVNNQNSIPFAIVTVEDHMLRKAGHEYPPERSELGRFEPAWRSTFRHSEQRMDHFIHT
jgi:hypothetical protein